MYSYISQLDTELSAVNSILGSIGQAPITELNFSNPEIATIYQIFQETLLDTQTEGWTFNTFYNVELPVDNNKNILVPKAVLHIDQADNYTNRSTGFVVMGLKLYDKIAMTDEFDGPVRVDFVVAMEWEDLPAAFKRYVIARASTRAATQLINNTELVKLLAAQESYLRSVIQEFECNQGDYSYFGTPDGASYSSFQPFKALQRF